MKKLGVRTEVVHSENSGGILVFKYSKIKEGVQQLRLEDFV